MTDFAAKKRRHRAEAVPEAPGRNLSESPLAWLAQRKDKNGQPWLSQAEIDAGEKLRNDFWFAQMTPRTTANWSLLLGAGSGTRGAPDIGPDIRDSVIAAQERVRRALAAAGPELANLLIDICCHLKGLEASEKAQDLPQRSGKVLLRIALQHLARHYGLVPPAAGAQRRSVHVRHWGSDDYKPRIEPDP